MLKYFGMETFFKNLQEYSTFSEYNVLKYPYFSQCNFATLGNVHNLATISFSIQKNNLTNWPDIVLHIPNMFK